jgi:hypothetical protein
LVHLLEPDLVGLSSNVATHAQFRDLDGEFAFDSLESPHRPAVLHPPHKSQGTAFVGVCLEWKGAGSNSLSHRAAVINQGDSHLGKVAVIDSVRSTAQNNVSWIPLVGGNVMRFLRGNGVDSPRWTGVFIRRAAI